MCICQHAQDEVKIRSAGLRLSDRKFALEAPDQSLNFTVETSRTSLELDVRPVIEAGSLEITCGESRHLVTPQVRWNDAAADYLPIVKPLEFYIDRGKPDMAATALDFGSWANIGYLRCSLFGEGPIRLTFKTSSDFKGKVDFTLYSNWYDWGCF